MSENKNLLSNTIPVFPLSNFIIFPKTTVPLNIFEERYLSMVDDAMKKDKLIGMIQPSNKNDKTPNVYKIGCVGKIVSYNETNDGRYLIVLNGISRFNVIKEIENRKLYREFDVSYEEFKNDQLKIDEKLDLKTFDSIFMKLKSYFDKQGYSLNWQELRKQNLELSLNTLSMAAPFTKEEKQALIETKDINARKKVIEKILETYLLDDFSNTTVQ